MTAESDVDPRLRVLFLVGTAVGIFFLPRLWMVGAALGAMIVLALAVGIPPKRVLRQIWKLWGLTAFLVASYALTRESPEVDRWVHVPIGSWTLALNTGGALVGLLMVLRVLVVVLASQVARAGNPRAVAAGLTTLWVPKTVAASIDAVLALLGGGGGGGGGGRGDGRRRDADGDEPKEGFWASVKRLGRGDVAPIVMRLERQISRAEAHTKDLGVSRDVAVIAGVTLTMLGIRALKILPSIPFAPGHKLVLLTPLYIVASLLTKSRFGGTITGITMGTVAFLMGDGKYGIFEIFKHVAPGIICDLFVPMLTRGNRMPGGFVWSVFGAVIAAGRFATIFLIVFTVQAPKVAYAMLIPGLTVHCTFGAASGYVSYHIVRAVARLREGYELANKELA